MPRPTSAEITPTSVTPGKSWPLAIICVPTSTSISSRAESRQQRCGVSLCGASSRGRDAPRAHPDTSLHHCASTRSVPSHLLEIRRLARRARRWNTRGVVAVMTPRARRETPSPWTTSDTLQFSGQSSCTLATETTVAYPRRLSSTIALLSPIDARGDAVRKSRLRMTSGPGGVLPRACRRR